MTRAWGDGGRSCPGRPVRVSVVRESVEARRRPCVAGREADRAGVSRGHGIGRSRYSLPGRGERQEWSARGSARTSRSDRRHPANAGLPGGADGEPVGAHSRAQRPIGARRGRRPPRAARTALGGVSLGRQPARGVESRPGRPRRPGTLRVARRVTGGRLLRLHFAAGVMVEGARQAVEEGAPPGPRSRHRSPPSCSRTSTPGSRHTVTASCATATTCASSCADGGSRSGSRRASPAS